jgi:hypothetical protein
VTDQNTLAPSLVGVGAQAIMANARRLGLTWTLTRGTISSFDRDGNPQVLFDGDQSNGNGFITTFNMSGQVLFIGTRVYVLVIPPSGNYVMSPVSASLEPSDPGRGVVGFVSSSANTAAISAETVIMTTPTMQLKAGRAYRAHYRGAISTSVTTQAIYRIHVGTTTAGQTLDQGFYFPTLLTFVHGEGSVIVTNPADKTTAMSLTLQANAGTVTGISDPTEPRQLDVTDVGPATAFPGAEGIT